MAFAQGYPIIVDTDDPPVGGLVVKGCVIKPQTVCRGADLSHAKLRGANLAGADLREANLDRADLT